MSAGTEGQEQKSPLREIIQPFIDLMHAPRALWGINLAYVLEGMVYFGMLGYLAIYCSEYIFQAIDGADEAAHYMVMVLTAGITIAMFFLGVVADKRGVRFALIAAFILMLIGRFIWAGAPTLFGLEPARPNVVAGDRISLHVTGLDTRRGNKTITKAVVIANNPGSVDVDATLKLDLAAGEGTALGEALESRLVRLGEVRLVEGEGQEWKGLYGSEGITAKMFIRGAKDLHLRPGATISLDHAYVALNKEDAKNKRSGPRPVLEAGAKLALSHAQIVKKDKDSDEFVINVQWPDGVFGCTDPDDHLIIRSHWVSDVAAVNTFPMDLAAGEGIEPNAELDNRHVRISEMTLVAGEGDSWEVTYGDKPVKARVVFKGRTVGMIREGFSPDLADAAGRVPDEQLVGQSVRIGRAVLLGDHEGGWELQYGSAGLRVPLHIRSKGTVALQSGATVALRRAQVVDRGEAGLGLRANWPDDFVAIDTYGCEVSPYRELVTRDERDLKVTSSVALAEPEQMPAGAQPVTIAELREMADGRVNVVLRGVSVTYVRNGGYLLQADEDGPAIAVFVSPFWSPLQIVTMVGILVVVLGYGMYQPAAYAGVRKFTTPKTAAMGFAMLYALMNLGGWLPSFAFLARDDDYLGLGIRGTFWIYVGFTLLALVCTALILSRRTVATAEATAKAETARLKAEANAGKQEAKSPGPETGASAAEDGAPRRVKPHMWLFWVGAIVLFLFKGESPWYYTWTELMQSWSRDGFLSLVVWRWLIAGAVFVLPLVVAAVPGVRNWIARHPLQDAKFAYFIFALIPVQTLFTYNWLVLPAYIKRAYEGWLGQYFEIAANANPILIFIAVPIITAITQKAKVYNMMIYGTFVMAAPAFLLVLGPHWWALLAYIFIMTIGEAMWQPRFLQYAAEIAPEGRTGEYMGVAQLPWFLTKVLVPILYSGRMMDRFCPAVGPKNTEMMWFIFACIAMLSTVLLILAKGWIGRDFKTRAD